MKPNSKIKIFTFLLFTLFAICYLLLATIPANAQISSQFLVSWQAESYVPSWYQGKIFPTKGSAIKVDFELIESGKIIDLSQYKVRWYLNDKLRINENSGLGIKSFSFITTNYPNQNAEVRIVIVNYKGQGELNKIVDIPVVAPEAIINAPYPSKKIDYGSNYFKVYPFFFGNFDYSKFAFEWAVRGQSAKDDGASSDELKLNIDSLAPSGFEINVSAAIKNLLNEMEFAGKNIQLQVK